MLIIKNKDMISLNKAIYAILMANAGVTGLTGTRIYPVIIPPDTALPMVVLERRTTPDSTKDNNTLYSTNEEIVIMSADYSSGINVALAIHSALEHYSGTISGIIIRDIIFIAADETYSEDAFIQKLTFVVKSI